MVLLDRFFLWQKFCQDPSWHPNCLEIHIRGSTWADWSKLWRLIRTLKMKTCSIFSGDQKRGLLAVPIHKNIISPLSSSADIISLVLTYSLQSVNNIPFRQNQRPSSSSHTVFSIFLHTCICHLRVWKERPAL